MERGEVQGGLETIALGQVGALRPCELRRVERTAHGRAVVCGAADVILGVLGRDDAAVAAVCRACPMPEALTDRWACLHLRPIRFLEDGQWQSFFSCRWFYRLNPQRQPRSPQEQCHGCPYWFPRPGVALIPRYWDETRQIRAAVAEARSPRPQHTFTPAFGHPSPARGRGAGGEGCGVRAQTGRRPAVSSRSATGFWRRLWSRLFR